MKKKNPRSIEALAFAVSGVRTNEWDQAYGAETLQLLGPDELQELALLGVEVGSHSRSHREMPLLEPADLNSETMGSVRDLEGRGLPRPRFFAFPYGSADEPSRQAVRQAGFLGAFGLKQRRLTRSSDPFDLPRVIILASDRGWRFRFKTAAPRLFGWMNRAGNLLKRFAGIPNAAG